jgi:acyl-CoA reductase-like NAD-dependent aldehyde dehydrogenase
MAAANGKRVQALTEAKNHALVLRDCKLDRRLKESLMHSVAAQASAAWRSP